MTTQTRFTPGPWRWEMNRKYKVLHLVGGDARYDLTIMDFYRWGLSGAVAALRDPAHDGMNVMHRLCDRQDWIAPFPNREHHADWSAAVTHPDMQLMAASPRLYAELDHLVTLLEPMERDGSLNVSGLATLNGARAALSQARGEP